MDRRSDARRRIAGDWDRSISGIAWSPDSKSFYAPIDDAGTGRIYRFDVAKGTQRALTKGSSYSSLEVAGKPAKLVAIRQSFSEPPTGTEPEKSVGKTVTVDEPPQGALPKVPDGFAVQVFATGFKQPRTLRVAPTGDIFLSESGTGRVLVFRAGASGAPAKPELFAENLDRPYGIAFVPPADPRYVYVAAANQVVRYPYRSGAAKAAGPAEVVIGNIPTKRHWTRDLAISRSPQWSVVVGSLSSQRPIWRTAWRSRFSFSTRAIST